MSLMSVRNYQYLAEIPSLKNSLWTYFRFFFLAVHFSLTLLLFCIFSIFSFSVPSVCRNLMFCFILTFLGSRKCAAHHWSGWHFQRWKILKQKNLTRTAFHVRNDININVISSFSRHGFFVGPICAHFSEFPSVVFVGFWELWRPSRNFTCTTVKLEFL